MICPHCNLIISKFSVTKHVRSCILNPEMQANLWQWLPDPSMPGYIRTCSDYEKHTPTNPSREHIMSYYGTWSAVAEAYGLKIASANERRQIEKYAATGVELRRLSEELHNGRYAPSQNEYHVYAKQIGHHAGPFELGTLIRNHGDWASVLAHFNMALPLPARNKAKQDDLPAFQYGAPYWFSGWFTTTNRPTTFALASLS